MVKKLRQENAEDGPNMTIKAMKKDMKKYNIRKTNKNNIRVSPWNIRTMLRTEIKLEIVSELERYKIHIAALQETRWKKRGQVNGKNFTILYSGEEMRGKNEVAFIVMGTLRNKVI